MKIKLLVSLSGALNHSANEIIDVDNERAQELLNAGYAVPFEEEKTERAVKVKTKENR